MDRGDRRRACSSSGDGVGKSAKNWLIGVVVSNNTSTRVAYRVRKRLSMAVDGKEVDVRVEKDSDPNCPMRKSLDVVSSPVDGVMTLGLSSGKLGFTVNLEFRLGVEPAAESGETEVCAVEKMTGKV